MSPCSRARGRWGRKDVHLRRRHALHGAGHAHGDFAGEEYGTGSSRDWAARARSCWASRPWWRAALSASTAPIWWAWACCRCSSKAGDSGSRWAFQAPRSSTWCPTRPTPQSDAKLVVHRRTARARRSPSLCASTPHRSRLLPRGRHLPFRAAPVVCRADRVVRPSPLRVECPNLDARLAFCLRFDGQQATMRV